MAFGVDTGGGGFSGSSSASSALNSSARIDQRKVFNIGGSGPSAFGLFVAGAGLLTVFWLLYRKK